MNVNSKGLISWFSRNPVAANLVMVLVFFAGAISLATISKEMFPRSERNMISISVPYPGAAPVEVEKGVILPMESVLEGLQGIKKITSGADRDYGRIYLEIEASEDINDVLTQVENRIDSIVDLPDDMEKPTIKKLDSNIWAIGVVVYGELTKPERKALGDQVYDEVLALPEVKDLNLYGAGTYEISIEVKEDRLRELNLTLSEVANAVRVSSLDLPAGIIRSEAGNVLIRTEGKAYVGQDFENIVLRSQVDGTQLLLSDVAEVRDGFTDTIFLNHFDRETAITLAISSLEGQNVLTISEAIHRYVDKKRDTLPKGLSITTFNDLAYDLQGRLDMMSENLVLGGILVALVLGLFLNLKVAFWVILGIPVSFAGAFWLMPMGAVTVNVLSLFAFIMVLGIVVDDAIVIGESVFSEAKSDFQQKRDAGEIPDGGYEASVETVVAGAQRVAIPSTIGVLTTMAAFFPIIFIGGSFGGITSAIGIVVILCLTFSLIESKLILPAHLVGLKFGQPANESVSFVRGIQSKVSQGLKYFIDNIYGVWLRRALRNRYITLAGFLGALIIALGAVGSGIARFEFFPMVPGDGVQAEIIMQDGASVESMLDTIAVVEDAIFAVDEKYRLENPGETGLVENVAFFVISDVTANFRVVLTRSEFRTLSATEIERLWRDEVGLLPDVRKQKYSSGQGPSGAKISLSLSGSDPEELTLAGMDLQQELSTFPGVYDIYNSQGSGSKEVLINLKPYASQIGITLSDVARQVRQAFYGEEAQRIQRDSDTVKVMVRYPYDERRSILTLENMHIRAGNGEAVAIGEVAEISLGVGLTAIDRLDRKRTVTVTAEVEADKIQSGDVVKDVTTNFVPQLLERYPSVSFRLSGGTQEQNEYYGKMAVGFLAALFMIYGLLAVPLRSYIQPVVIMSVIPFGFIGAVIGHMVFSVSINILSVFGIIALAGVVVNDSLILVEFANRGRKDNLSLEDAIVSAGKKRFRAILLTTLTTFVGLLPLLFETSAQAQFVIPMALSLSFGILFASTITLVLIPCLYFVVETNHQFVSAIFLLLLGIGVTYSLAFLAILSLLAANALAGLLVIAVIAISVSKLLGYFSDEKRQSSLASVS
ncbi:efflux RND transporter permease subunit [Porticoccaceae bacterium]|nr:efflux RND transporter permease subunit [Porticoccaceae bacterium]MDB2401072.1 efflux RND transporter permease subunit [Porticoccaceae bacterium]